MVRMDEVGFTAKRDFRGTTYHIEVENPDHVEKGVEIINNIIDEMGSPDHPCVAVLKEIVAYHHEFLDVVS